MTISRFKVDLTQAAEAGVEMEIMTLPTGEEVVAGSTVSVCVRRTGHHGGRQMRWYAGSILKIEGGRALVELDYHPGERASLGPSNIRIRKVQPPKNGD